MKLKRSSIPRHQKVTEQKKASVWPHRTEFPTVSNFLKYILERVSDFKYMGQYDIISFTNGSQLNIYCDTNNEFDTHGKCFTNKSLELRLLCFFGVHSHF